MTQGSDSRDRSGAIIVAAGRSQRMGGGDKLLALLGDRPVIAYSLAAFAQHPAIDQLVVVASETNAAALRDLVAELAPAAGVVLGGARRRDSVVAGLDALSGCDHVVIHDGARPFVSVPMIDAALDGAREAGAALCAVPVSDTLKRADASGLIASTISREGLWLAQTPQAFRVDLLRRAHAATDIEATDDAALVELLGGPVKLVPGSNRNIKITLQEDLALAEALLRAG